MMSHKCRTPSPIRMNLHRCTCAPRVTSHKWCGRLFPNCLFANHFRVRRIRSVHRRQSSYDLLRHALMVLQHLVPSLFGLLAQSPARKFLVNCQLWIIFGTNRSADCKKWLHAHNWAKWTHMSHCWCSSTKQTKRVIWNGIDAFDT